MSERDVRATTRPAPGQYAGQEPADHGAETARWRDHDAGAGGEPADADTGDPPRRESLLDVDYVEADPPFAFPASVRAGLADPASTVVIVADRFGTRDVRLDLHDAIPDASHGALVSALIQASPAVAAGTARGTVHVANVNTGDDPAAVTRVLQALPADRGATVLVSLAVAGRGPTARWRPVARALEQLAAAGNEGFAAFVPRGRNGILGQRHPLAALTAGMPGIHPVDPRGSARRATLQVSPTGDVHPAGGGPLGPEGGDAARMEALSAAHGAAPARAYLGRPVSEVFASAAERQAVANGEAPRADRLYDLATLAGARRWPPIEETPPTSVDIDALTAHLPNPDPGAIHVDPVAVARFAASEGRRNGVVFFEASPTGHVQAYGGASEMDLAALLPEGWTALPAAVADRVERRIPG